MTITEGAYRPQALHGRVEDFFVVCSPTTLLLIYGVYTSHMLQDTNTEAGVDANFIFKDPARHETAQRTATTAHASGT